MVRGSTAKPTNKECSFIKGNDHNSEKGQWTLEWKKEPHFIIELRQRMLVLEKQS